MNPSSNDRLDRLEAITLDIAQEQKHLLTAQILTNEAMAKISDAMGKVADGITQMANGVSSKRTEEDMNALIAIADSLIPKPPTQ